MSKKQDDGSWLGMLKMELSLIDTDALIEPESEEGDDPKKKDETVLGPASMEVRKLWTYFATLEEKATRTFIEARYCKDGVDAREQLLKAASEMKAKAEMARSIIFLSLRDQHGVWNPHLGVGLRRGWQVVTFKSSSNPLLDLIRGEME